ncbi:hypothetical protein LTR37_016459 [Vermiconidia calcicola]|uniref:Uncharacterized protein n=1 Tax=Vermiconidia calcicola TaxID=1690605 RepID=A0ACC3MNJ5_9PEZI|nr:hypothetical protein LTR37_016459 [Vermiconidia calcicola]
MKKPQPLDEKEAQKLADQPESKEMPTNEKQGLQEQDFASVGRKTTIQYSDNISSAPETIATQSISRNGGTL